MPAAPGSLPLGNQHQDNPTLILLQMNVFLLWMVSYNHLDPPIQYRSYVSLSYVLLNQKLLIQLEFKSNNLELKKNKKTESLKRFFFLAKELLLWSTSGVHASVCFFVCICFFLIGSTYCEFGKITRSNVYCGLLNCKVHCILWSLWTP